MRLGWITLRAFSFSPALLASFVNAALFENFDCPPVDKDGTALTKGEVFADGPPVECIYPGAGFALPRNLLLDVPRSAGASLVCDICHHKYHLHECYGNHEYPQHFGVPHFHQKYSDSGTPTSEHGTTSGSPSGAGSSLLSNTHSSTSPSSVISLVGAQAHPLIKVPSQRQAGMSPLGRSQAPLWPPVSSSLPRSSSYGSDDGVG
ncbi:hypothetical protein B0H17DRAFT_1191579 [Mycena rosella]|uniref:C2H2-type domain-containing protein n=1 Tax=Mycena rosella TaxID=1033263 RepID=A0AAD7GYM5_MYCRO|nr:hypothetical protein B0H17DRAFT_1191579 [Mycena rosella]